MVFWKIPRCVVIAVIIGAIMHIRKMKEMGIPIF